MIEHLKATSLIIGLITLLISCGEKNNQSGTESVLQQDEELIRLSRAQFEENGMQLIGLSKLQIPTGIRCSGVIDVPPQNRATISPFMDGYVKQTRLLIGDKVNKGEVLVVLENPDYITLQQDYLELSERLAYLEAEYQRQVALREENITSTKNYLKAESDYKSGMARFKGLASKLRLLGIDTGNVRSGRFTSTISLRSPIAGRITRMDVTTGMYAHATDELMEIVSSEHMHLELTVYEKDVLEIHPGQPIVYSIPESSDQLFTGDVYLVGTALNEDRSIKVHGHLNERASSRVLTGMFAEATIITDSTEVRALPATAFVQQGETSYILQLEREDKEAFFFRKQAVEDGAEYRGMRSIGFLNQADADRARFLENAYLIQSLD